MSPIDWTQVEAIFDEAMSRDPDERRAFVHAVIARDPELGREVASLLEAHEQAGDLLDAPVVHSAAHLFEDEVGDAPGEDLAARRLGSGLQVGRGGVADSSDRREDLPHDIAPYIVRHELGRGGMGIVYLADDTRLSRRVALKAIPRSVSSDPVRRQRLRQEARATAALSHPGIATVFALEEFDGQLYIASEYVPGQTLKSLAASAPVSIDTIVDVATQMARALAAAHAQGIVHRDLKPENVMRTSGGVIKILDFGIARFDDPAMTRLTEHGALVGTIGYMAPEQVRGQQVDVRADLFSFGVLIHELTTGSHPFDGGSSGATLARALEYDPPPLSTLREGFPPALAHIVATCLNKDPAQRFTSASALVAALERAPLAPAPVAPFAPSDAPFAPLAPSHLPSSPLWWWEFHQVVVSCVYALALVPAWIVRTWIPRPWGMLFLFAMLACVAASATLRLHLWFSARFYPAELVEQRISARPWMRLADASFAALQIVAALAIGDAHPEVSVLLIAVSISALIASFMIEPATARAAFGRPSAPGASPRA